MWNNSFFREVPSKGRRTVFKGRRQMGSHVREANPKSSQVQLQSSGRWLETTLGIVYVVDGHVQFVDDHDHWKNAFCRLLEIKEEKARQLIETTVEVACERFSALLSAISDPQRVECLTVAVDRLLYGKTRPAGGGIEATWGKDMQGAPADTIYSHSVSGDPSRIVVGNREHEFGWLVDPKTNKPVTADSIVYDTTYFSSGGEAHYGMKHYIAQVDWRLEKSRRLVRTVLDNIGERKQTWLADPKKTRVMDIGSGIGYYRKAFDDHGLDHYGIDLSTDIIAKCKEYFGFDTWHIELLKLEQVAQGKKFHMITMWDVIEHLEEPMTCVAYLKDFLTPDGVIVARTPNLSAIEADILGDYYYSFKFDHVRYFSVNSLNKAMHECGLKPVYVETASHLFKGVLSPDFMYKTGESMRGADIVGVYGLR
jgi:2-polyprenyl-3-methyl-5-hydroxy-6-metoxy-1,4-benzoquinol methylase